MSDYPNYREVRDGAREKVVEAAQEWIDGYEDTAGGLVTGFVLIVESTDPDGSPSLTWCSGNGMPTGGGQCGLARWRVTGMLDDVASSIRAWLTAWFMDERE